MSISSATPQRRPFARLALVSVASLGLIGGSVAVAGPASASGYGDRDKKVVCWVKAKKVDHHEEYGKYSDNRKKYKADVKFEFKVWCSKKTDVKFEHKIYQKNARGHWKEIGHDHGKIKNVKHRPVWEYTEAEVKDRGPKGGHEKVFHIVKIKFDYDKKYAYSHAGGTVTFYR